MRDLRGILEALSAVAATEKDPLNLAEYVRSQMRRAITFRLTAGAGQLDVVLLDPLLEDTVRRAVTRTAAGAFLTLAPAGRARRPRARSGAPRERPAGAERRRARRHPHAARHPPLRPQARRGRAARRVGGELRRAPARGRAQARRRAPRR